MTTITFEEATREPLLTDDDIETRVADLIGRACERQLWLLFLDRHGVQLREVLPIAGYPISPGTSSEPPSGRSYAAQLAAFIARMMTEMEAEQVVLVWERGLSRTPTPADQIWAKTLGAACSGEGVTVRAQLISHRKGVRLFSPDEYE
ncbi:MAG: hypothetical protein ABI255_00305 [Microbacteriaceae bacterium]